MMDFSLSKARQSCVVWMVWFLGLWLVLEAGPLFLGVALFKIPLHQLIGPYLAIAIAPAAAGPIIYRVNRRRADPPKRRARNMAIAAALFLGLEAIALCYSAVKVGLLSAKPAIITVIITLIFYGPFGYFVGYRAALAKATASRSGGDFQPQ